MEINGEGEFKEFGSTHAMVLYGFDDLILLIQPTLPNRHAWLLLNALKKSSNVFKDGISPEKLTAVIGMKDVIIVNLNDATLVMPMNRSEEVKKIVDMLSKEKDEYL